MDENIELRFIDSNIQSMAEVLTDEDPDYRNEVKDIDESIRALYEKKAEIKMRYIKLKKENILDMLKKGMS